MSRHVLIHFSVTVLAATFVIGCGITGKKDNSFYTSGNREADQRADQRMAKAEQLSGTGDGTGTKQADPDQKRSLYDRLGGEKGLTMIVNDYIPRVIDDPRVNWDRIGVKRGGLSLHRYDSVTWDSDTAHVNTLKTHMVQFLALATGGPSKYQGREMTAVHQDMHISNPEFDAAVGDLKATLDKLQVANQEQKELLSVIESTRQQVVEER